MARQPARQQDQVLDDGTRDDHDNAPQPVPSSTWRLELVVAVLGLIIGLTAALAFLG